MSTEKKISEDWLKECLSARERRMYRIAMVNAKDPHHVDNQFHYFFSGKKEEEEERILENMRKRAEKYMEENP